MCELRVKGLQSGLYFQKLNQLTAHKTSEGDAERSCPQSDVRDKSPDSELAHTLAHTEIHKNMSFSTDHVCKYYSVCDSRKHRVGQERQSTSVTAQEVATRDHESKQVSDR